MASPLFLEGLGHLKRFRPDSLSLARDRFERAIRDDRDNPSIYVAMADYYAAAAVLAVREPKQLFPKAEWAAKHALELDPGEIGAHGALAVVEAIYHCRWDLAATHFRSLHAHERIDAAPTVARCRVGGRVPDTDTRHPTKRGEGRALVPRLLYSQAGAR